MHKRLLFDQLASLLSHKNALVITGMRQVGKSTLMRQLYDEVSTNKLWFDLDNPLDCKTFETEDYVGLYHYLTSRTNNPKDRLYLFLDEIQNLPPITKIIKYLIDHYQVKFVVTGSSNFYLKNLFPESLSGRKFVFDLAPLSFTEFLYFRDYIPRPTHPPELSNLFEISNPIETERRRTLYTEYLRYGGFPEVTTTPNLELKSMVLKNIFKSFFEKDLQLLSDLSNTKELRDFILLLAPRVGSLLDISKLSLELGISRQKIYSYLEFLQGIYLIRLLPKFSRSVDRAVAGGTKLYFSDNGILQTITTLNPGQILENAVINQLFNYGTLSFYNYRNMQEIDCILDQKYAFEIKATGDTHDLTRLNKLSTKLKLQDSTIISLKSLSIPHFLSPTLI